MTELPVRLPIYADPPAYYRLEIPAGGGWVTLNQRQHWRVKARLTKHYRQLGQVMSLHARLPRLATPAYLIAELRFASAHRRDPHNWVPTAKAVLDGMVDAGVFPDDDHKHVTGPDMRLGPPVPRGKEHLVIHVWPAPT